MKTLNKLVTLILIILKTTPEILRTYKKIYENLIKNEEILISKSKQMIEADKVIHTTYVDEPKVYDEKIKNRFKRQRNTINKIYYLKKRENKQ